MRLRPGVPVLLRERDHVQVGLTDPLSLRGLSTEEREFLASLEGRRAAFSRSERERHGRLIDALDRHGLLEPARPPSGFPGVVRIHGVDPVTTWLAVGLVLAGVSELSIVDPRRPETSDRIPGFPGVGDDDALLRLLRDAGPSLRMAAPEEKARLEVLRAHGASDLVLTRTLTSLDVPHLDIVTDERAISVGPLIVPGRTPCETCLGIGRTERDSWWPRLALQLGDPRRDAGLVVPVPEALAAAGIAIREIIGFFAGEQPSSTLWRIPFGAHVPESRVCLPHPDCGCGAGSASRCPPQPKPSVQAVAVTPLPPGGA